MITMDLSESQLASANLEKELELRFNALRGELESLRSRHLWGGSAQGDGGLELDLSLSGGIRNGALTAPFRILWLAPPAGLEPATY